MNNFYPKPVMNSRTFILAAFFVAVVVSLSISGCSSISNLKKTGMKIVRDISIADTSLVKKIGIAQIENISPCQGYHLEKRFQDELIRGLNAQSPGCIIITADTPGYTDFLARIPRNQQGNVDSLELTKQARALGFNSIVTLSITDIQNDHENNGWLWFASGSDLLRMKVSLEVYSMQTGAKLADETLSFDTEIEAPDTFGADRQGRICGIPELDNAIFRLASESTEKIYDTVSPEPWVGFILSVDGNKMVISSGEKSGLLPGDVFEVHDGSRTVEGIQSQRFFIPGKRLGEIRILKVFSDSAEAEVCSGGDIQAGCTVTGKGRG